MQATGQDLNRRSTRSIVLDGGLKGDDATLATALGGAATIHYADSTDRALELIARHDSDLVIWRAGADPSVAADLFGVLSDQHPEVLRILLCAPSADIREYSRAVPGAHQVLHFPSPQLARALGRTDRLREVLGDATTRRLVLRDNKLPATPATYRALQTELRDPRCSVLRVARIVENDLGVRARLLQIVSSAFLGLPAGATSVGGSIAYLGLRTVQALVLAAEIGNCFRFRPIRNFSPEALSQQSLGSARIAKRMLTGTGLEEYGFIAALFHGVGHLVLASREPAHFEQALALANERNIPLADAQQAVLGTHHARVGGYLLAAWGLPALVAEAVTFQDQPEMCDDRLGVSTAVYVSRRLALNPLVPLVATPGAHPNALVEAHLAHIGSLDALPGWRTFAQGPN